MNELQLPNTYEEDRYLPIWILVLIAPITILMWAAVYIQLIEGKPFGAKPASDTVLIILWIIFGILLPSLFYFIKYRIRLNNEQLVLELIPFYKNKIRIADIQTINLITVRPLIDFGGWGLRFNGKKTGLIIEGKVGIEVKLKSNEIIVIASKRSEQLYKQLSLIEKKM
ncbi:DUF6141 domain-containing protein [Paenibacillus sediminis]|uniref:DUF304 domain-containing protein n=1 Tax=Paenibacillus sediminis TaxID=664909 RepID=A0ABS4H214_9BACL|nr:DUF6141 family protein [Paenibacillus sediminis]MBP1936501.1 hypothetical protein [Paenibacillus sediminis]